MKTSAPHWLFPILAGFVALRGFAAEPPGDPDFFEKRIRPLLEDHCVECHGEEKQKGNLRLDSRIGWSRGGESGTVIVPGKPDDSLLITAIRYWDKSLQMPPDHALEASAVKDLIEWVKQGAPDPRAEEPAADNRKRVVTVDLENGRKHWAFQPIGGIDGYGPPAVRDAGWARNDVDRFILARIEAAGVEPAPDADRSTLIRRATFDLTGLPPTPEEVDAFLRDESPDAWSRVVDRLLASPRYGERWGRHWLDVARYADTCGNASDYPIPQMRLYRDYVLQAFNDDLPFDQFIREQIAGDLLPHRSEEERRRRIVATGYLANARRFAGGKGEPHLTIEDAIENVGRAFLGMSLSCARCHDHKFDPIASRDYYALYGIFSSTNFPHPGSEGKNRPADLIPLVTSEEVEKCKQEHAAKLAALDAEIKAATTAKSEIEKEPDSAERKPRLVAAVKTVSDLQKQRKQVADTPIYPLAYAVSEGESADARLHVRGDPARLGETVPRGFLQILGAQTLPPETKGSGRRELAEWIASPSNPLTARVFVNRLWQHHFGRGLVTTSNDFGTRGQAPSHPELLDYLASRFIESGWSTKAMHRLILHSRTWQLSTEGDMEKDPNNLLWARAERRRLDAESIRDTLLMVSGDLDLTSGGEHPFPAVHTWGFTQHNQFFALYDNQKRAVYQMQQRLRKHPFLSLFDGADTNSSTAVRSLSTTPLQSLFAMNDPFVHTRANRLAERLQSAASSDEQRIDLAFLTLYGRRPEADEIAMARDYLTQLGERKKLSTDKAWTSLGRVLLCANEFLYLD